MLSGTLLMNNRVLQHHACSIGIEAMMMASGLMMVQETLSGFVDAKTHFWIVDQFAKSHADDPIKASKRQQIDAECILEWNDEVESFRQ